MHEGHHRRALHSRQCVSKRSMSPLQEAMSHQKSLVPSFVAGHPQRIYDGGGRSPLLRHKGGTPPPLVEQLHNKVCELIFGSTHNGFKNQRSSGSEELDRSV